MARRSRLESVPSMQQNGEARPRLKKLSRTPRCCKGRPKTPAPTSSYHSSHAPHWMKHKKGKKKNSSKSATWNTDLDEAHRGKPPNQSSGARTTSFGDCTSHQKVPRKKRVGRKKPAMPSYSIRMAYAVGVTDDCLKAPGAASSDQKEPMAQEYFELVAEQWGSSKTPGGGGGGAGAGGGGGGRGRGDRDRRNSARLGATETTDKAGYSLAILRPMTPNGSPVIISTAMYSSSRETPPIGQGKNWSTCQNSSTGAGDSSQYMSFMSSYRAAATNPGAENSLSQLKPAFASTLYSTPGPTSSSARAEESPSSVPHKTRSPSPHTSPLRTCMSTPMSASVPKSVPRTQSPSAITLITTAPPPTGAPLRMAAPMMGRCDVDDASRCPLSRRHSTPPPEAPSVRLRPRGAAPTRPAPATSPRRHASSPPVTTQSPECEHPLTGPHMQPYRASDHCGRAFAFPCLLQPTHQGMQREFPSFEIPPSPCGNETPATRVTSSYGTPTAPLFPQQARKAAQGALLLATGQVVAAPVTASPVQAPPPRLPTTLPSGSRVGGWYPVGEDVPVVRPTASSRPLSQIQGMAVTNSVASQHTTLPSDFFDTVVTTQPVNLPSRLVEAGTQVVPSTAPCEPIISVHGPTMISTAALSQTEGSEHICQHVKTKPHDKDELLDEEPKAENVINNIKVSTDTSNSALLNAHGTKAKVKLSLLQTEVAMFSDNSDSTLSSKSQSADEETMSKMTKHPVTVPTSVEVTVSSPIWRDRSKLVEASSVKQTRSSTTSVKVTVSSPSSKKYLTSIAPQNQVIAQPSLLKKSKSSTTSFKISVSSVQHNKVIGSSERPIMIIETPEKQKTLLEKTDSRNLILSLPEKRIDSKQNVDKDIDPQGKVSQLIRSCIESKLTSKSTIKETIESSETPSMTSISTTSTNFTKTESNSNYSLQSCQPRIHIRIPIIAGKIEIDKCNTNSTGDSNKSLKPSLCTESKDLNELTTSRDAPVPVKQEEESNSSTFTDLELPNKTFSAEQEELTECSIAKEIFAAQKLKRENKDQTLSDIDTIPTLQEVRNTEIKLPISQSCTTISGDISTIMEPCPNTETVYKSTVLMQENEKQYKMQSKTKERTINVALASVENISCTSSSCSIDTIKPFEVYCNAINQNDTNTLNQNKCLRDTFQSTTSISEVLYREETLDLSSSTETLRPPSSKNRITNVDETPKNETLCKTMSSGQNLTRSSPLEEIVSTIKQEHKSNFPEIQKIHDSLQNMTQFLSRRVEEVVSAVSLSSDGTRLSTRPLSQLTRSTCDSSIKSRMRPVSANAALLSSYPRLANKSTPNNETGVNLQDADNNSPSVDSLEMSSQMVANMIGLLSDTISELTGIPIRMASEMIKAGSKMRRRLEAVKKSEHSPERFDATQRTIQGEGEEIPKVDTKSYNLTKMMKRQWKVSSKEVDDKEGKRSNEHGTKHNKIDSQKVKNSDRYKKHPKSPLRRGLLAQKREKTSKNHAVKKVECAENKGVMTDLTVAFYPHKTDDVNDDGLGKEVQNTIKLQSNMEGQNEKISTKETEHPSSQRSNIKRGDQEDRIVKAKGNIENKCLKKTDNMRNSKDLVETKTIRTDKQEDNSKDFEKENRRAAAECLCTIDTKRTQHVSEVIDKEGVERKNKQNYQTGTNATESTSLIENVEKSSVKAENTENDTESERIKEKTKSATLDCQRMQKNIDHHPLNKNPSVINDQSNGIERSKCMKVQFNILENNEKNCTNISNAVRDSLPQKTSDVVCATKINDTDSHSKVILKSSSSNTYINSEENVKKIDENNPKIVSNIIENNNGRTPRKTPVIPVTNSPSLALSSKNTIGPQNCVTFMESICKISKEKSPEIIGAPEICPGKKLENKSKLSCSTCYRVPRKRTRIQSFTQPITTDIDYPSAEDHETNKTSEATSESSSSSSTHTVKEALINSKQSIDFANNMSLQKSLINLIKDVQNCRDIKTISTLSNVSPLKGQSAESPGNKLINEVPKVPLTNPVHTGVTKVENGPENGHKNDSSINVCNLALNFPPKPLTRKRSELRRSPMRLRKHSKIPDSWNPLQLNLPPTLKFSDFRSSEDRTPKEPIIRVPSKAKFEFKLHIRNDDKHPEVRQNVGSTGDSPPEYFTYKLMENNDIKEAPERDTNPNIIPMRSAHLMEERKSKEMAKSSLQYSQNKIQNKEAGDALNITGKSHSDLLSFLGNTLSPDMEKKMPGLNQRTSMIHAARGSPECETYQKPAVTASASLLSTHLIRKEANESQPDTNNLKDKRAEVRCLSAFAAGSSNAFRRKTAVKKWIRDNLYPTQNIILTNTNESFKQTDITSKCEAVPIVKKGSSEERHDLNKNVLNDGSDNEIISPQNENPENDMMEKASHISSLQRMKEVKSAILCASNKKSNVMEYDLFRVSNIRRVLPPKSSLSRKSNNNNKSYYKIKTDDAILDTSPFDSNSKNKLPEPESIVRLSLKTKKENDFSKNIYQDSGSKEILNEKLLPNIDGIAPKDEYTLNINDIDSMGKSSSYIGWSQAFDKYRSFQKSAQCSTTKNNLSLGKAASEKSLSRNQNKFFSESFFSSTLNSFSVTEENDGYMFGNDIFSPPLTPPFEISSVIHNNDDSKGIIGNKQKRIISATKQNPYLIKDDDKRVELRKKRSTANSTRQNTYLESCSRSKFPFPKTVRKEEKAPCSWVFGAKGLSASELKSNACSTKCHAVRINTSKCSSTTKTQRMSLVQRNYSKSARVSKVALQESSTDLSEVASLEMGDQEGETHAFLVRVKHAFTHEPTISLEHLSTSKTKCRQSLDKLPSAYLTAPKSTSVSTWIEDDAENSFAAASNVSVTRLSKSDITKIDNKTMPPSSHILSKLRCERKTYGQVSKPEDNSVTREKPPMDIRLTPQPSDIIPPPLLPSPQTSPLVSTVGTSISSPLKELSKEPMASSKEENECYRGARRPGSRDYARRPQRGVVWGRRWCKHTREDCDRGVCEGAGTAGDGERNGRGGRQLAFCESAEDSNARKTPRVDQRLKEAASRKRAWRPGTHARRRGMDAATALRDCKYLCSLAAVLDRLAAVYREADPEDLDDCPTEDEVTWDSSGCGVQIKQPSSASPAPQPQPQRGVGGTALSAALEALVDEGEEGAGEGEGDAEESKRSRPAHNARDMTRGTQEAAARRSSRIPVLRRQQPYQPEYPSDSWCFGLSE